MTASAGDRTAVPDEVFRDVIGPFPSGVTVIRTTPDGGDHGTTASAVSSLPRLLVCLSRTSDTRAAILESQDCGVNIPAQDQRPVGHQFARKGRDGAGRLIHQHRHEAEDLVRALVTAAGGEV